MSHINYVSNAWHGCACVQMKQLYSLHERAIKFLMPSPNMDYNQKCCGLKRLPLDKQIVTYSCGGGGWLYIIAQWWRWLAVYHSSVVEVAGCIS